jgi:hypothetical protein
MYEMRTAFLPASPWRKNSSLASWEETPASSTSTGTWTFRRAAYFCASPELGKKINTLPSEVLMTSSSKAVSVFTVTGSSRWRANWGGSSTASVLRRSGGKVVPYAMSSVGRSMPSVAFTMSNGRSVADMSTAPKAPSRSGFVTSVGMQLNSSIRPETWPSRLRCTLSTG